MNPTDTSNSDPSGLTPNGSDPKGITPSPSGLTPNGTLQKTSFDTLPLDVQLYIKDLRKDDEAQKGKLKQFEDDRKKQEDAAAKALAERMKQQGEFQKLAEQHEARVKEIEPTVERFTALTSLVSEQIEAQIKDWPAEAKIFDPGKDAPIESRLEWMNKAKALVDKLQPQQQTKPGNGPNPKPAGEPTSDQLVQQKMDQLRATRKYF